MNRFRLFRWSLFLLLAFLALVTGIHDHWGDRVAFEAVSVVYAAPAPKEELPPAGKSDWVMFGGTPQRNMVNHIDKNLRLPFDLNKDLKWKIEVGSRSYPTPIVSGGRIFVGTNNDSPRNDRDTKLTKNNGVQPLDKGILLCLKEKDGELLWQAVHDKLEQGHVLDWPKEGITSTPTIDGNRVYYMSNRCELICADFYGLANGNQGYDKEKYQSDTDVDILWKIDLIQQYNVQPHAATPCSPLIVDDLVFIVTANGVEGDHKEVPEPTAPSFMAVNKHTGKVKWTSNLPGKNVMHGQWSNPVYGVINKRAQVIFPGGDGWLYSFDPLTGKLFWKFDANSKDSDHELGGRGTRNDFIGSPVIYQDRIYIGTGQDPEHFTGVAHFHCINPTKDGDISAKLVTDKGDKPPETKPNPNSGVVWTFGGEEERQFARRDHLFGRTMSTACIVDDVIYIAELFGYLHCIDAKTGNRYWVHDVKGAVWGSCYYVDGKVILGTEDGDLFIFKHEPKPDVLDSVAESSKTGFVIYREALGVGFSKSAATKMAERAALIKAKEVEKLVAKKYLLEKIEIDTPTRSTPTVANGVLYVMSEKYLFAFKVAK